MFARRVAEAAEPKKNSSLKNPPARLPEQRHDNHRGNWSATIKPRAATTSTWMQHEDGLSV